MKRKRSTIITASVSVKDFKRIKEVLKITKCKAKITKKVGMPFFFDRHKKRKMFLIFLLLIFLLIFISSMFVWNVEIKSLGNVPFDVPQTEILESLREAGLETGKFKHSINISEVINEIRLKRDDIAWVGVSIKGTNAVVEIVKREAKPQVLNINQVCNIVSNKTGIITKIVVRDGTAAVKIGDIIQEGTILVSAIIEGKYTEPRYVHADAEIEAKVWYSAREKIYLNQALKVKTGAEERKFSLNMNDFKINLYKTVTKFETYDTILEEKKLKIFNNFYLPITIETRINYEITDENKTYSLAEAKEIGVENLRKTLIEKIEKEENIVNTQVNYFEGEGYVEVELIYEVLEMIGEKQMI